MPARFSYACPECQTTLKLRPEYFGQSVECRQCHHRFSPPLSVLTDLAPAQDVEDKNGHAEKVEAECPGCRHKLKVRRQYLGQIVTCNHCEHHFIASIGSDDRSFSASQDDGEFPRIVAALETKLSGLQGEFDEFRRALGTGRADLDSEIASRFEAERDFSRDERDRGRAEAENLRAMSLQLASQSAETASRLVTHGGRLDALEKKVERRIVREKRIRRKLSGLDSIRRSVGELQARCEQLDAPRQNPRAGDESPWEQLRDQIASIESEQGSYRRAISGQEERRGDHDSALARLEASQGDLARLIADVWAKAGADSEASKSEFETLQARLEQTQAELANRQAVLDQALSRLVAIESERDSLQETLEGVRGELASIKSLAVARSDETRREVAELRASLNRKIMEPSANGSTPNGPKPTPAAMKPVMAGGIRDESPIDFDALAENILSDRLSRGEDPSVSSAMVAQRASSPRSVAASNPPRATAEIAAEYNRLGLQFNRSMSRGVGAESIEAARDLVEFTRENYGAQGLEHALWLRNLGVCLSADGQRVEARDFLRRALAISQANADADHLPHAVCLIDLTELHLAEGELRPAKECCQRAIALLKKLDMAPSNPISVRVQGFRDRIDRMAGSNLGAIRTTTIIA